MSSNPQPRPRLTYSHFFNLLVDLTLRTFFFLRLPPPGIFIWGCQWLHPRTHEGQHGWLLFPGQGKSLPLKLTNLMLLFIIEFFYFSLGERYFSMISICLRLKKWMLLLLVFLFRCCEITRERFCCLDNWLAERGSQRWKEGSAVSLLVCRPLSLQGWPGVATRSGWGKMLRHGDLWQ